jgi:hypothetical protein
MTDTAKNLKDRLMQVVEQGGTIDNAVRDDMFNQVMA